MEMSRTASITENGSTSGNGEQSRLTPEMRRWVTERLGMTEEQYLAEVLKATEDSIRRAQAESASHILGPLQKRL